jgi:archaellum component FlaC
MTKKAVAVVSLLAVAFVGVLVWAILTANELVETRYLLSSTRAELALRTTELEETKDRLTDTENELTGTKIELTSTKNELASTEIELASTKNELASAESELASTESELTSTKNELASTEIELASTQQQLSVARETLRGLDITLWASKECSDVALTDNPGATNPTWSQLMAFLSQDRTETHTYIRNVYDCSQFSRDVHNNAEAAGIRAAEVQVDFSNEINGHALNAFLTTDYGLVYVDCTGGPDTVARIKAAKVYRAVSTYYIPPTNIRNDYWWDTLNFYYYMSASMGGQAVTSSIRIFW